MGLVAQDYHYESESNAFFAQTGYMTDRWKVAYNNFVKGSKNNSLWNSYDFIMFHTAPTASVALRNLKNPSDTLGTNVSSMAWDFYGLQGNGSSSYLNTNFNPSTDASNITATNCAFGVYQRTSTAETSKAAFGLRNGSSVGLFLNTQNSTNVYQASLWSSLSTIGTSTDGSGLQYVYRSDNTIFNVGRNGSQQTTSAKASSGFVNGNIYVGSSNNNGTAANFSANQYALSFAVKGDIDFTIFTTLVNNFLSDAIEAYIGDLMDSYKSALTAQSGSLNATELGAARVVYRYLLSNNMWTDTIDFGFCCLGGNLNSALIKNKSFGSITNNNFVSGDYNTTYGINTTSNTTKYLQTGITPTSVGLSKNNICAMVYRTTEPVVATNSFMMGLNNASGFNEMSIGYEVGMDSNKDQVPTTVGMIGVTSTGTTATPYFDLTQVIDDFTPGALAFNTEITLFKGTRSGIDRFTDGGLGFWYVGHGITKVKYIAFTQVIYTFLETIGRRATGSDQVNCGDSVTMGSFATTTANTYSRKLAVHNGLREANFGLGGTRLQDHSSGARDFMERYTEIANYRVGTNYSDGRVHLQYLINDMSLDSDPNGTTATANACRDAYITAINYIHGTLGVPLANITLGGPGYTTVHNDTKRALYTAKARESAVTTGIKFCDINQAMIDTGVPTTFLDGGVGVHPNDLGHDKYYQVILTANFVS